MDGQGKLRVSERVIFPVKLLGLDYSSQAIYTNMLQLSAFNNQLYLISDSQGRGIQYHQSF